MAERDRGASGISVEGPDCSEGAKRLSRGLRARLGYRRAPLALAGGPSKASYSEGGRACENAEVMNGERGERFSGGGD